MIDFSPVLQIVLYSHLHCVHFIDLKSYFVFMCYNFVSFNQIHHVCNKLDYVTLFPLIYFIPACLGKHKKVMCIGSRANQNIHL